MFDGIYFTKAVLSKPVSSDRLPPNAYDEKKYDEDNLRHSEFFISGSTDAFLRPPITDYAKDNLYFMQAFNIFHYEKGSFTRRCNYNSFLILYTYSGTGYVEYEGKKYTLNTGDGVFIDCRKAHYYKAVENWDVAVFHFRGGFSEHMSAEYEKHGSVMFHEAPDGRFHRYLEELVSIYDSSSLQRDLRANHCIDGILLYLVMLNSSLAISKNDVPRNVQSAMKYMEQNYAKDISLDDLAGLTNNNKYHLAKEFKKYTSFSPHDYLIRLRINQAKILLKSTSLPVVKIAHSVGIHDINNFNYLFKKRVGKTPVQYRNSAGMLT